MPVPTEIYLCGKRFEIRVGGSFTANTFIFGMMHYAEGWIELCRELSEDNLREFLWHELIHGFDKQLDLNLREALRRTNTEKGLRLYEAEVLAFSTCQWQTLSDPRNREAVLWLLKLG